MPQLVSTVTDLRRAIAALKPARIAMVPTMGALHAGHVSLVAEAKKHADHVVVSIFVNPTQFAPHEDFDAYPRTLESDLARLGDAAAIIFAPTAREMYPDGHATTITVKGPSHGLETDFRPQFFSGVATVVAKIVMFVQKSRSRGRASARAVAPAIALVDTAHEERLAKLDEEIEANRLDQRRAYAAKL